jgi:hypothetical protein
MTQPSATTPSYGLPERWAASSAIAMAGATSSEPGTLTQSKAAPASSSARVAPASKASAMSS